MLTLFSIPKAFEGHIGLIQRNALASWRRLAPAVKIILFGRDAGVAEAAQEFGADHDPAIAINEHGTPLVSDAFARATRVARTPWLMFSNADMLYDPSLLDGPRAVQSLPHVLLSGRRWDIDITADLSSMDDSQWRHLFASGPSKGVLHGPAGMDFFVFRATEDFSMPQFAVGRPGWDSWLVWRCRSLGLPVIDATRTVRALHQNHSYAQLRLGYQHVKGPERDLNLRAAGGLSHLLTLREANLHLVNGRLTRPPWRQCLPSLLATSPVYQKLLALKRSLR